MYYVHALISFVPQAESSATLSLIIHTIYGISCTQHPIPFQTIISTVQSFPSYGLAPSRFISPSLPLYNSILWHAPLYPLDGYSLAASFDLYDLASAVSSHLLSFELLGLTDEHATQIGPIYLKRLFFLHIQRQTALKNLLLPPPQPHPESDSCKFADQRSMSRAWTLVAASLTWDARAGELVLEG